MVLVARAIGRGWSWNKISKKLKWSQEQYIKDCETDDNERTARVLSDVANTLNKNIQTTVDLPSRNHGQIMPVLDLKMLVNNMDEGPKVMHTFYKKEVASRFTIMKRSAINSGTKKSTKVQVQTQSNVEA